MSKTYSPADISVCSHQISSIEQLKMLKPKWAALFQLSGSTFFLSWRWIGSFSQVALEHKCKLHLVEAIRDQSTVGLGIFCEAEEKRHYFFKYKQLYLHKAGREDLDKSWIEYNDLLLHPEAKEDIREAMWSFVTKHFSGIDEFVLGLSERRVCRNTMGILDNFLVRDYLHSTGYILRLDKKEGVIYQSKQAHSQIRRSNRLLSEMGVIFSLSENAKDYINALEELQPLHKNTWKKSSGFNVPPFIQHLNLLSEYTDTTKLISAKLVREHQIAGILIGFVCNGIFYYYLSANENNENNKIKVGLSLHHLVIEWCNEQGLKSYDFLAGDYRYKRSFTDNTNEFSYLYFQRPTVKAHIEHSLRYLKQKLSTKE